LPPTSSEGVHERPRHRAGGTAMKTDDADFDEAEDYGDECDPDDDDDGGVDCHLTFDRRDGLFWCGKAGSEECDWECPYSSQIGTNGEEGAAAPEEP
jgi:hypothetical protein